MIVRSVALSTELELAATRGIVTDRGDYLVVRTPDDPSYYFGNVLVLPAPPQVGEVAYWTRRFDEEFRDTPEIQHVAFRWDGSAGDPGARDELRAAGFAIEDHWVMSTDRVNAPAAWPVRALAPSEMHEIADLGFAIADDHSDHYRQFLNRSARWKADLVESGVAKFYGAFEDDALVGSLGLAHFGDVARYQDVQVAATHRRRGIASTLLAAAADADPTPDRSRRYIIVAEPESDASRVYTRAGFTVIERMVSTFSAPASR